MISGNSDRIVYYRSSIHHDAGAGFSSILSEIDASLVNLFHFASLAPGSVNLTSAEILPVTEVSLHFSSTDLCVGF